MSKQTRQSSVVHQSEASVDELETSSVHDSEPTEFEVVKKAPVKKPSRSLEQLKQPFAKEFTRHGSLKERHAWLDKNETTRCQHCTKKDLKCVPHPDNPPCRTCTKRRVRCSRVADERKERLMKKLGIKESTYEKLLVWYEQESDSESEPAGTKAKKAKATDGQKAVTQTRTAPSKDRPSTEKPTAKSPIVMSSEPKSKSATIAKPGSPSKPKANSHHEAKTNSSREKSSVVATLRKPEVQIALKNKGTSSSAVSTKKKTSTGRTRHEDEDASALGVTSSSGPKKASKKQASHNAEKQPSTAPKPKKVVHSDNDAAASLSSALNRARQVRFEYKSPEADGDDEEESDEEASDEEAPKIKKEQTSDDERLVTRQTLNLPTSGARGAANTETFTTLHLIVRQLKHVGQHMDPDDPSREVLEMSAAQLVEIADRELDHVFMRRETSGERAKKRPREHDDSEDGESAQRKIRKVTNAPKNQSRLPREQSASTGSSKAKAKAKK